MPIVELYSSRLAEQERPADVWIFDQIPRALRIQTSNIVKGALGSISEYVQDSSWDIYVFIRDTVAHEHGRDTLRRERNAFTDVHDCLRSEQELVVWLDVVELSFRCVQRLRGTFDSHRRSMSEITISARDAVAELNERFRRAGFGYRYEDGKIMRIDNEFMYQEATRPALMLLHDERFSGANEEFRAAHDHFKAGEYKDCAVDALNALESTMKAICDAKKWPYPKGSRATDLLKILRRESMFPEFADQSFDQLLATLKSGLPALRNDAGGHGQGATPIEIPDYIAAYALNLAGSKIRMLVEAFRASEEKQASRAD